MKFQYLIQKLAKDGKVPLSVIRQGKTMKIDLPVKSHYPMLIEPLQGKYPSYFVYGPLVFSPVTERVRRGLRRGSPRSWRIIGSPLVTRRGDKPQFEGEELVIVTSPMFPHRIGKGYDNPNFKVVKEINGIRDQEPPPHGRDSSATPRRNTSPSASTTAPARRSSSTARRL